MLKSAYASLLHQRNSWKKNFLPETLLKNELAQ